MSNQKRSITPQLRQTANIKKIRCRFDVRARLFHFLGAEFTPVSEHLKNEGNAALASKMLLILGERMLAHDQMASPRPAALYQ